MGNPVKTSGDTVLMIAKQSKTIFSTNIPGLKSESGKIFKQSVESKEDATETTHYAWGGTDQFPRDLDNDAKKDTVILPGLRFKTEMQFGAGIQHGAIEIDEYNKEVFIPKRDPKVVKFFRNSGMSSVVYSGLYDLNMFAVAFPLFHPSADGKRIVRMSLRGTRARSVRLTKADQYGNFKQVLVNADFGTTDLDPNRSIHYDCMPMNGAEEWLMERKAKGTSKPFVIPVFLPDSGNTYYPNPDWNSARESKWMEISKQIALFKSFVMENQVSLQYHIEIHPEYWTTKFQDWETKSPEEKRTIASDEFNNINDNLTKSENAGRSIMTAMGSSKHAPDKTYELVKVTEVGHKFSKDGTYIEDSQEASEHKISALGLHPEIIGSAPGQKMGAGSGSGNRVAFNQRVSMSKAVQDFICEPLYAVAMYNDWGDEMEFRFRNSIIETKDKGDVSEPKEQ